MATSAAADAPTFDYVVVGAGPSGAAVARRLAEAPDAPRVAVLEAGPRKAPLLSDIPLGIAALVPLRSPWNYAFETVPQPELGGRRGYQPRGRGVGGSSLINAMIAIRGQPEDYDGWAALGCDGWGWRDVLPLFRRMETSERGADAWHGGDGPLHVSDARTGNPVVRAFVEAGLQCGYPGNADFNGPTQEGFGVYQLFQRNGRRLNAGRAYLDRPPVPPNLAVLAGTQVRRVLFEAGRAVGIEALREGRPLIVRAAREVVLSAGAFGSPHLLMLSGIGPAPVLKRHGIAVIADRCQVGENLQDHLDYTTNVRMRGEGLFGLTLPVLARGAAAVVPFLAAGRGMLTSNAAEGGAFVRSGPGVERPDLQFHFCIGIVDDHNRRLHFTTGAALHVCALRPESRGRVTLASADVRDAPRIDPAYLSAPGDLDVLLRGAKIARRILAAPAFARYGATPLHGTGREDDAALRALIRSRADSIYHPVGTCRMGADADAVVDPRLRVHGVAGLRVADAAIMPRLVSGNTQAPCAMIGEKAADLMIEDNVG